MSSRIHNAALRAKAAVVLVACLALLICGAALHPSHEGMGTHTQLGLATCSWIAADEGPCPTCGMTTAVSLAAHGQLTLAFATQPAAAMLALLAAMTAWIAGYTLWTGSAAVRHLKRLWRPATVGFVVTFVVLAWVYKIAIAT